MDDAAAHAAAHAFERGYYGRAAQEAAPHPLGLALRDDRFPRAHVLNQLWVTATGATATELVAALEERQGHLDSRVAFVQDAALGRRLRPELEAAGFEAARHEYLVRRRPRDREPAPALARLATEAEHTALEEAITREYPHGKDEQVVGDLTGARAALRAQADTLLAVGPATGPPVGHATLLRTGGVAQLEDVATLEAARGRGIARAVCTLLLDAAGTDLLFLVADQDDWPKELYGRLGFDRVGTSWNFTRLFSDSQARLSRFDWRRHSSE